MQNSEVIWSEIADIDADELVNSCPYRTVFQIALALSMQETHSRHWKKDDGLSSRFSKQIQNMKMTKSSQNCTICLSGFCSDQIIKRFPCRHIFHRECAKAWLKTSKKCPNCRFDLQDHFQALQKQPKQEKPSIPALKHNKAKQVKQVKKIAVSRTQMPEKTS